MSAKDRARRSSSRNRRRSTRGANAIVVDGAGTFPYPAFEPTEQQRRFVWVLASIGTPLDRITRIVVNPLTERPISKMTLLKHFRRELDAAETELSFDIANALYRLATGDGPQAFQAARFVAMCRMGWNYTQRIEAAITAGVLVAPAQASTAEEWIEQARLAAARDASEDAEEG